MGGDFNCKRNHQTLKYITENFNIKVIEDDLNQPTRVQKYGEVTQETRIDFFITNCDTDGYKVMNTLSTTDHRLIICNIKNIQLPKKNPLITDINKK